MRANRALWVRPPTAERFEKLKEGTAEEFVNKLLDHYEGASAPEGVSA